MIAEDLQAMHSQCAEDPKDKDFDNSVVAQLIERTSQAEAERDEAKAESAACADFLDSMYSWECFWSDGWIIDDQQKISQAQENARQLKNYLVTSGHGVRLLRERDAAQEKLNRLNFDRTDNTSPFTRACHLLQDGFISVGKALEWWRVYVDTGNLEPIADGEGESVWDENEKLKSRVKELEAQVERLSRPVTDEEMQKFAIHTVDLVQPVRRVLALLEPSVNKLIDARSAELKKEKPPQS